MSQTVKSLGWGAIPYVGIIVAGEAILAYSVAQLIAHPVGGSARTTLPSAKMQMTAAESILLRMVDPPAPVGPSIDSARPLASHMP